MTKLTHAELAAAHERRDWPVLWEHAIPIVRMVVRRLFRNSAEDREDLEQEGMVITGTALRSWRPFECTLSTYVANQVGWALLKHRGTERNHGIGSHEQRAAVLSLGDSRDGDSAGGDSDDEDGGEQSFDAALTYEGVLRNSGQYDGTGVAPEGFGDPADEAEDITRSTRVLAAVESLPDFFRHAITAVYGLHPDHGPMSPAEYAAAYYVPLRTVERRLQGARQALAEKLANS